MYRKTFIEVNLDNIAHNVKTIINKYPNYKYYIGMVKANAYGHGMYVVKEMIANGINYLAVSSLEEAIKIRKYDKNIPILCTEVIELDSIEIAIKNKVTFTIHDINYLKVFISIIKNEKVKIHIKIDTGMNRLGVKDKTTFDNIVKIINANSNILLEGIYTHFATPGIYDKYYDEQLKKFIYITSDVDLNDIPIIHMSSSFILLSHPKIEFCNAVRLGTILYGYDISNKSLSNSPKNIIKKIRNNYSKIRYHISDTFSDIDIDLKKCFKLKTNIIQIKEVNKGEKIGYGLLYTAKTNIRIAILPIGYDDGIGINHEGRYVLINNNKYYAVGEISMCLMSIIVDDTINVGDEVTVVGDSITLGSIARLNNTSFHNTIVNIGKMLPRVYIKNNRIINED